MLIGVVFFAIGRFRGVPFWDAFIFAIGIIVAMVPEGLLPTLTLALVLATQRMARRNVLIRHLPSVETLGSTTVICTDKTGTLTQNRMLVKQLFLGGRQHSFDLAAADRTPLAESYRAFFLVAAALPRPEGRPAPAERPSFLGDPMESRAGRRWRRRSCRRRAGPHASTRSPSTPTACGCPPSMPPPDGADAVLQGGARVDRATVQPGPAWRWRGPAARRPRLRSVILAAQDAMAEQGLRVLALAYRPLDAQWTPEALEQDLVWAGLVGLQDPPRPEVPGALRKCREAGIRVIMTTGDHPRTALAIAREIGLVRVGRARS